MIQVKKNIQFTIFLMIFSLSGNLLMGQSISRVGTTSASFLKIGVGARALSMGGAVTTISEDVTSLYWNPAGISKINKIQAVVSHYDYIADIFYDYDAVAIPVGDFGVAGMFFSYLGMPDLERTTIENPNGTGEKVPAYSYSVGFGLAKELTDRFAMGFTVKYINETLWHSSASAFSGDIGLIYTTLNEGLKIGMSISNLGGTMKIEGRDLRIQHDLNPTWDGNNAYINGYFDTDRFPLPTLFRAGVSSNLINTFMPVEGYDWTVSVDAVHPNDNNEYVNAGTEFVYQKTLAFRAGYNKLFIEDNQGGFAFGFGFMMTWSTVDFTLDYANVDYGLLDRQNQFSMILAF